MFSTTADYAVRAILILAREGGDRPLRTEEIADATGAPRNYLSKTLHALSRAKILTSTRGPRGGFMLAIPPDRLTLARIVDVFDEPRPQLRCMLGRVPCNPAKPCAVHDHWTAIVASRRAPLATTTVADLLG